MKEERARALSGHEDGMAHTFFPVMGLLSGLVSRGIRLVRGWNLPVSGLESSQGRCQGLEGLMSEVRMAWLDL